MGIFPQVGLIAFVNGQVCLLQDTLESTWTSTTAATFLLGGGSGEASLWTLAITTTQSTWMERRSNMAPTTTRWVHGPWRINLVSVCRIRPKRVYNNTRFLIGVTVLIGPLSWRISCLLRKHCTPSFCTCHSISDYYLPNWLSSHTTITVCAYKFDEKNEIWDSHVQGEVCANAEWDAD